MNILNIFYLLGVVGNKIFTAYCTPYLESRSVTSKAVSYMYKNRRALEQERVEALHPNYKHEFTVDKTVQSPSEKLNFYLDYL